MNGDDDTIDDVDVVADDMEDNARFKISNAGVLTFKEAPNFEAGNDDNSASDDNNYQVVVQASDGATMETLSWYKVTVEVTDVEETGKVTWMVDPDGDGDAPGQDLLQFQAGAVLTAMVTDPDGPSPVTDIEWQWYRSSSMSGTGDRHHRGGDRLRTPRRDTPSNSDVDMYLRAMATYTDRRGGNKEAEFVSPHRVQATQPTSANSVPEFAGGAATRRVVENTDEDMNIGGPVAATDADGDVLTYSLGGDGRGFVQHRQGSPVK